MRMIFSVVMLAKYFSTESITVSAEGSNSALPEEKRTSSVLAAYKESKTDWAEVPPVVAKASKQASSCFMFKRCPF